MSKIVVIRKPEKPTTKEKPKRKPPRSKPLTAEDVMQGARQALPVVGAALTLLAQHKKTRPIAGPLLTAVTAAGTLMPAEAPPPNPASKMTDADFAWLRAQRLRVQKAVVAGDAEKVARLTEQFNRRIDKILDLA